MFSKSFESATFAKRLETYARKKDGTSFPVSLSATRIYDAISGADRIVCIAQDISKRKRLEAESRVISRIIHGVTSTANLDQLLRLIHRSIKKILYAENCFVALFDPETEMLSMQFFVDKYDEMPPPFKVGRGLTAYVFRKRCRCFSLPGGTGVDRSRRGRVGGHRLAYLDGGSAKNSDRRDRCACGPAL